MSTDPMEIEEEGEEDQFNGTSSGGGTTPPYMSFTGFIALLDRMVEHGPPAQIDRDFFGNPSGSWMAQTMSALKFFGLVDERKRPTATLRELVVPETRKERLRRLIEAHYPKAVALGSNATQLQLDRVFPSKGGTLRKAVTFYLQAAEFTGIPLSPYFSKSRPVASPIGTRRGNGSARKVVAKKAVPPAAVDSAPTATSSLDLDEKKSKYIDLLLKLAEKDGAPNETVLDRLHTVLGYSEVSKGSPTLQTPGVEDS